MGFVLEALPRFAEAAWINLQLAAISCVLGFLIALPVALARLSDSLILRGLSTAYVLFFRGTPLLAQIFLIYYGAGQFRPTLDSLGLWGLFRDPWFCAILTLTLNTGAYTSEILRGAITAIPKGEIEAARALGFGRWLRLRLVVMPRAIRIAWPAYTNEVVYQIQATSLVSVITIMDITGVARAIGTRDFRFYEAFGMADLFYLVLVYAVLLIAGRIEHRLSAHTRRTPGPARPIPDLTR
ncbi:ABC transporter permease [Paracoccus liaowanqingii]|uniref:ABC transporter permease n=1 Tax=Paracoccus liaowanqingii TaxID=2560053 RepID=A0A4P7HL68_9RHOB|nr:ABC transporter permease [Paracoccus liaowanqingii]QBX34959.1 ABC transporter permease [Paracoccus liaowanqingii]